jgi:hypothetical protein
MQCKFRCTYSEKGVAPIGLISPSYLEKVILLQGKVSKGYGRGSKKLGVPTANLDHFHQQLETSCFNRGVYLGWGQISDDKTKLRFTSADSTASAALSKALVLNSFSPNNVSPRAYSLNKDAIL